MCLENSDLNVRDINQYGVNSLKSVENSEAMLGSECLKIKNLRLPVMEVPHA